MGVSNSRLEEDKSLQLCRARKKFIKQALNGRCSLAAAHLAYIEDMRNLGAALSSFVEPDGQVESIVHLSRNTTPGPLPEKRVSQLSLSPLSLSHIDAPMNASPSSFTPVSNQYQSHHMKFRGTFSKKVEEKPPEPVAVSVASTTPPSMTPRSTEVPEPPSFGTPVPPETPPWDYFGLFHPIDNHFASREGGEFDSSSENFGETRHPTVEEGIPQMNDVEEDLSSHVMEESQVSEDEFDEPPSDSLVRKFENVNRTKENAANGDSPVISLESKASETKFSSTANVDEAKAKHVNGYSPIKPMADLETESKTANDNRNTSPALSPLRATSSRYMQFNDVKITPIEQNDEVEVEAEAEDRIAPKDFFSSMKDIELLFIKASDSGKEVPRMLEANKFHFRPVDPRREGGSIASLIFKSCFSCGEDPSEVPQEPPQNSVKYLTWHRTTSSRSASSQNLLGHNANDGFDGLSSNLFDNFCMVSGSHASTLDRLYAWEKKLYDEVKAAEILRTNFDQKCRLLRQQESRGEPTDKTRAVVKDLHTRIKIAIQRINSISMKIEEIRDKELQPQLEELIEGLKKMWEMMHECHNLQFHVISVSHAPAGGTKISIQTDSRRQVTIHLEHELSSLSSTFTKWITAQKLYVESINKWLFKCVTLPQNTSRRNKRMKPPPIKELGPPIYMLCASWLDMIEKLPSKQVLDSIKDLAAEVSQFLPRQTKNHSKSGNKTISEIDDSSAGVNTTMREETFEDCIPALDRFRTSLAHFLGHMSGFSESCVKLFGDLQSAIQEAKNSYQQFKLQQQQQQH